MNDAIDWENSPIADQFSNTDLLIEFTKCIEMMHETCEKLDHAFTCHLLNKMIYQAIDLIDECIADSDSRVHLINKFTTPPSVFELEILEVQGKDSELVRIRNSMVRLVQKSR